MVRFRLKTPFLTNARAQIQGGVWYKPTWWDAVRKVPPLPVLPRIKKKDIPKLRFLEDRLIREFELKNPMIREHDSFNLLEGTNSIASDFADAQMEAMAGDVPEGDAYRAAEDWLLDNGRTMVDRMNPSPEVKASLEPDPIHTMPPADRHEELFRRQVDNIKTGLAADLAEQPPPRPLYAGIRPHRTFLTDDEVTAIQQRQLGATTVDTLGADVMYTSDEDSSDDSSSSESEK